MGKILSITSAYDDCESVMAKNEEWKHLKQYDTPCHLYKSRINVSFHYCMKASAKFSGKYV